MESGASLIRDNRDGTFTGLFTKEEIDKIVADGCEALQNLTARMLLEIHPLEYNRTCEFGELP